MAVVLIPDGREEHGLGHVSRSVVLANALHANGINAKLCLPTRFFKEPQLSAWITSRYQAANLVQIEDFRRSWAKYRQDYLVVFDTYDLRYVTKRNGIDIKGIRFVLIDDLALKAKPSPAGAITIVPNILFPGRESYAPSWRSIPVHKWLHGPRYVLLDPMFHLSDEDKNLTHQQRKARLTECYGGGEALRVLVSFGSSAIDTSHKIRQQLSATLHLLEYRRTKLEITALGSSASALCRALGREHRSVAFLSAEEMRRMYASSDVYLGAVGYSMWERCSMGLPSFVVPVAENQIPYAAVGEELGIHQIMKSSSKTPMMPSDMLGHMGEKTKKIKISLKGYLDLFKEAKNRKTI